MVRWLRWHCPLDTGFEIRALAVWGRARYLSVTEAPHNTSFHTWMGKKQFCFFQTAETGNRTPDSGVKGSGANHYPIGRWTERRYNREMLHWASIGSLLGQYLVWPWWHEFSERVVNMVHVVWLVEPLASVPIYNSHNLKFMRAFSINCNSKSWNTLQDSLTCFI